MNDEQGEPSQLDPVLSGRGKKSDPVFQVGLGTPTSLKVGEGVPELQYKSLKLFIICIKY